LRPLIPRFIAEQFEKGTRHGSFQARVMFIDLTDFTPLTEQMMQKDKDGAEQLSVLLNGIFGPLVGLVYKYGGFVPYFAGDAFTGIFPIQKDSIEVPDFIQVANEMRDLVRGLPPVEQFRVGVKLGLSEGNVEWGIVGGNSLNFYFKGEAIDGSSNAQKKASEQEIITDSSILRSIPKEIKLIPVERTNSYYKLDRIPRTGISLQPRTVGEQPSDEIARQFLHNSILNHELAGEFRYVVSAFLSFEGISSYEEMNDFVSLVLDNFEGYGGYFKEVDFGDKGGVLVGFFGAPITFENLEERALECVCTIVESVKTFPAFKNTQIKAGLTAGKAFTGVVGGQARSQYAVVGNRVNLAARLMVRADWGEILVDDVLSKNSVFNFKNKGLQQYKGLKDPIPTYILKGKILKNVLHSFEGPMIGRQQELDTMFSFSSPALSDERAAVMAVWGEGGMGKSRLVYEFKKRLTKHHDVEWYTLRANQILQKPFEPFYQFLKDFFEQDPENSLEENEKAFEKEYLLLKESCEVVKIQPELLRELERTKSIFSGILSLPSKGTLWDQLDAKARYENTIGAIINLLSVEASLKPIVLEIEDAQNLDENSRALLQQFARKLPNLPILVLVVGRLADDGTEPLIFGTTLDKKLPIKEITLQSFEAEEVKNKVESLLEDKVSDSLVEFFGRISNGNPFYLDQILQYFLESKILKKENGQWVVPDKEVKVSNSIQAILMARIDRLSNLVKETVKTAAVIGREFEVPVLSEVLRKTDLLENKVHGDLVKEQIKTAEMVKIWRAINELRYIFRHSLLREALYDMQLRTHLKKLHKLIGESIEKVYKGRLEEHYLDLAFHYRQANVTNKAILYLNKAASQAKANYQNQQALELYDQVLQLYVKSKNEEAAVKVLLKKAGVFETIGQWDQGLECLYDGLERAERIQSNLLIGRVKNEIGRLSMLKGDYDAARENLETARTLFKDLDDGQGLSKILGNLGSLYFRKGQYEEAKAYLMEGIELSRSLDLVVDAQIVSSLGLAFMNQGKYSEGLKWMKRQLEDCRNRNDKPGMATLFVNMGIVSMEKGDNNYALSCFVEGKNLSEELGNKLLISIATGCMGTIFKDRGEYEAAHENFDKDLTLSLELGDKQGIAIAHGLVGELQAVEGKFEEAKKHLKKSLKICKQLGYMKGIAKAVNNLGDVYYLQGKYKKAVKNYEEAIRITSEINHKLVMGESLLELATALLAMGKPKKAMDNLEKGEKLAKEIGNPDLLYMTRVTRARIFTFTGEKEKAGKILNNLLKEDIGPGQFAAIQYHFARLGDPGNAYVQKAIDLYEDLYKKTPQYLIKLRLEELYELKDRIEAGK
jgi:predicted ATPase/class 3 adenylate cyclase